MQRLQQVTNNTALSTSTVQLVFWLEQLVLQDTQKQF